MPNIAVFAFLLVPLLIASCSNQSEADPERSIDQLAFVGTDGNVGLLSEGEARAVTNDAEFGVIYSQLTWSRQGDLAFVRTTAGGGEGLAAQAIAASIEVFDRSGELQSYEVPYVPFYMYWSPDGERLAFLGSAIPRLELSVLSIDDQETTPLFNSQPLYFDWSPKSDRIVTHHEGNSMVLLLKGEPANFRSNTGRFLAPVWNNAGIHLVSQTATGSALERRDQAGTLASSRAVDGDDISFSPGSGNRVAILQRFGEITGALGVFGGKDTQLTSEALWYFWDPDGSSLLWMEPNDQGVSVKAWNAATDQTTELATGELSAYWIATYLQFFDQYALSHSWWSADGSSFLFLGTIDDQSGIWRLDTSGTNEPEFLIEGLEAVFAP